MPDGHTGNPYACLARLGTQSEHGMHASGDACPGTGMDRELDLYDGLALDQRHGSFKSGYGMVARVVDADLKGILAERDERPVMVRPEAMDIPEGRLVPRELLPFGRQSGRELGSTVGNAGKVSS